MQCTLMKIKNYINQKNKCLNIKYNDISHIYLTLGMAKVNPAEYNSRQELVDIAGA